MNEDLKLLLSECLGVISALAEEQPRKNTYFHELAERIRCAILLDHQIKLEDPKEK